ncbi:MAG: hypothetical protein U0517_04320 [Candidatus Andersenbacteria bacterium]
MNSLSRTLIVIPVVGLLLAGCTRGRAGALFVSTDAGATFTASDKLNTEESLNGETVLSLAASAKRASVVFAGVKSKGVVVSRDAGQTWVSSGLTTGDPLDLVVHPQAAETLFAAVGQNILRSSDDGASFSTVYADPGTVTSIAIDPAAPQNVWAGTGQGSLVHSSNAGSSWQVAQRFTRPVTDVFVSPLGSAIAVGTAGAGFFVSADRGATFTERTPIPEQNSAAQSADEVVAIAQASSVGSPLLLATTDGLFSTSDLGQHWKQLPNPIAETGSLSGLAASASAPALVVAVASNTVAISSDGGATWATRDVATDRPLGPISIVGKTIVCGVSGEGQGFIERTLQR